MADAWNIRIPQFIAPDYSKALDSLGSAAEFLTEQKRRAQSLAEYRRQNDIAEENRKRKEAQEAAKDARYSRDEQAKAGVDISDRVSRGDVAGAKARAAAAGIPWSDTQYMQAPGEAPQLQYDSPPDADPGNNAAPKFGGLGSLLTGSLKMDDNPAPSLGGFQLRPPGSPGFSMPPANVGAPPPGADGPQANLSSAALTALGAPKAPPAANMAGLADQPDTLETGPGTPHIAINGQDVQLDPDSTTRRTEAAEGRKQKNLLELYGVKREAAVDNREDTQKHQVELEAMKEGGAEKLARTKAALKAKAAAAGGGEGGGISIRDVFDWDGKKAGQAPLAGKNSPEGVATRKAYAQVQPIREVLAKLREEVGATSDLERANPLSDRQQRIKGLSNMLVNPITQMLGGGAAQEQEARRQLDTFSLSLKQNKDVAMANIDNLEDYLRRQYDAKVRSVVPSYAGGGGDVKTIGKKTYRKINGEWHEE